MQNIQHIIDHAEEQCKSQGSRLTSKRKHVLSSLLNAKKALSAYELVEACKEDHGESIPAMSVYRMLDFLMSENLVHKLELANKYIACAHISCDHSHGSPQFLICRTCNKVEEVSIDKSTINSLQKNAKSAGFKLLTPQLELSCICDNCSQD